eukprot:1152272-Pelagomonas_calceolata.AAC.8
MQQAPTSPITAFKTMRLEALMVIEIRRVMGRLAHLLSNMWPMLQRKRLLRERREWKGNGGGA